MGFVREQPEVSLGKETLGLPESYKQRLIKNVSLPAERAEHPSNKEGLAPGTLPPRAGLKG